MITLSAALQSRLNKKPVTVTDAGSQISFTAPSTISTTQNDFITQGFRPGMIIKIVSSSSNNGLFTISSLAAGHITVAETTITTEAASAATPTITAINGYNPVDIFNAGIFVVYSSPAPADAGEAETGTKLLEYTVDGGAFTAGSPTNGITWAYDASSDKAKLTSGVVVKGSGIVTGTAYYARLYDNAYSTGVDSSAIRLQGTIGTTSNQDFRITTTGIYINVANTLNELNLNLVVCNG